MSSFNKSSNDLALLILRIGTGSLMLFHGIHKALYGHDYIKSLLSQKGLPNIFWIGVPIAEIIAPILLILGIFTRISTLLIAFVMLFSIYLAFGLEGFTINDYGGLTAEFNIFFVFVGVALFLLGPGKYRLGKNSNIWLQ